MMTSSEAIFQCGVCLRYFIAGELVALSIGDQAAAARAGQITPLDGCGLADCADLKAARLEREKAHLQRFQRGGKKDCRTVAPKSAPPSRAARLPYKENDSEPENVRSHAENQTAFVAEGGGDTNCERLLELLWQGFDVNDPTRTSRGVWISDDDFIYRHRIKNVHSRASQLRGSETLTPHPLVKQHRLDIDTKKMGDFWHYSVCFIEASERLARERDKAERGQEKLV